jgi:RNA polymerase sigma-70 factor (ECF subfamily)
MAEAFPDLAKWLPEARAGSREAMGQALEAYRAYLLLVANRQIDPDLRAKGSASDLVQETFLEAHRDFGQFKGESGDELQAWLRQLLLNNLANFTRRHRNTDKRQVSREVALSVETPSGSVDRGLMAEISSPSGQAMAAERVQALEGALDRLPEDYRTVINWRYKEGRSFEDIARMMQRSENAVRKLWFRAIERLQEELRGPDGESR